jgi:hypothetical protein
MPSKVIGEAQDFLERHFIHVENANVDIKGLSIELEYRESSEQRDFGKLYKGAILCQDSSGRIEDVNVATFGSEGIFLYAFSEDMQVKVVNVKVDTVRGIMSNRAIQGTNLNGFLDLKMTKCELSGNSGATVSGGAKAEISKCRMTGMPGVSQEGTGVQIHTPGPVLVYDNVISDYYYGILL